MCGIAGYFGWELSAEAGREALTRMCRAMVHRGPDGQGLAVFAQAGMAMRRLSIVDLAGGGQPLATDDGRAWLVFNGEIYNHRRLRDELAAAGATFRTTCDTEVLFRQLLTRDLAGLDALNGMFAFAFQDQTAGRLLLGRDRIGVKPLYYWTDGTRLLYASEIKVLLASGLFRPELEPRALWDYLTLRYVPAPRTVWQGVYKLPPGHVLDVRAGRPVPEPTRYWDYPTAPADPGRSEAEHEARFAALFQDAVGLRLLADVPVGVLLSGGLDSSAVAAVAARLAPGIKTFSVSFADSPATDERGYARQVARHLGADHHEVVIGQREFLDTLDRYVTDTDEPLADLAAIPLFHVCRLAREQVTVVLSGEGSDELLGGYDLDVWMDIWDREGPNAGGRRVPNMTDYLDGETKARLMGRRFPDTLAPLAEALRVLGESHPLDRMLRTLCRDWLVEDLLMKADKMSMACSLELRTPFLDYRLAEWAMTAPRSQKVGREAGGAYVSKRVLRRFASTLLPPAILDRPKQGFPVPVYDWLSGSLAGFARELLGTDAWLGGLFDRAALDRMLAVGVAADAPILDRHRLWNLLILELWGRKWLQS